MPTFTPPSPRPPQKQPTPEITPKPYRHSIVDSRETPTESLTTWIGGSTWTVDYYSQIFNSNEQLKPFDPKQLSVYQQYRKIHRFQLKLQGALSDTDEQSDGRFSLSGSAIVIPQPNFIPNVGDAFIADTGEGQATQFTVVNVQKLSIKKSTAWNIDFRAARAANAELVKLIDSKVVENLHFNRDFFTTGQNPLLTTESFNHLEWLQKALKNVSTHWLATNFSHTHSTLLVPNQDNPIYDPFVTRAALRLISKDVDKLVLDIIEYNVDDFRLPKYVNIYQAVIERDRSLLHRVFKPYQVVSTAIIGSHAYQHSIKYSGIPFVVMPATANLDSDNYNLLANVGSGYQGEIIGGRNGDSSSMASICWADPSKPCTVKLGKGKDAENNPNYDINGLPVSIGFDIPEVPSETYVLSPAFYNNDKDELTRFEMLINEMIDGKPINYEEINPFIESFYKWTRVEQFYLGPLLIALIKAAIRSF